MHEKVRLYEDQLRKQEYLITSLQTQLSSMEESRALNDRLLSENTKLDENTLRRIVREEIDAGRISSASYSANSMQELQRLSSALEESQRMVERQREEMRLVSSRLDRILRLVPGFQTSRSGETGNPGDRSILFSVEAIETALMTRSLNSQSIYASHSTSSDSSQVDCLLIFIIFKSISP